MKILRTLLTGLLLAALLVPVAPVAAQPASPAAPGPPEPPEPLDCPPGLLSGQPLPERVSCAHVTVPLNHDDPEGATIQLATARIAPATGTDAPPLLVLNGGPGSPTLPLAELFVAPTVFSRLAEQRELVLLDQRGVGRSVPALECDQLLGLAPVPDPDAALAAALEALGTCRDELAAEGQELGAYDTAANAADVGMVVDALGLDTVDVYAVSYGTTLALQVAKERPEWLRTLTLDSPVDPTASFVADVAPSFDEALDLADAACAAEPTCLNGDGLLSEQLSAAVADLTTEPMTVNLPAGPGGEAVALPLGGTDAMNLVFLTYYSPDLLRQLPGLVRAFVARDGNYVATLLGPLLQQQPSAGTSLGMQLSVLCAEEVAATSPQEVQAAAAGTRPLVRDSWLPYQPIVGLPVFDVCQRWDVPPADAERFEPVAVEVPTLIAVGSYDHITPAFYGEAVLEDASDATLVEFTDIGHSPLFSAGPCGIGLLQEFLQAPTEELTTGCADDPSPFAPRPTTRLAGADRVGTAVAASQQRFEAGAAGGVVLAAAGSFPDALTGAALAVELDAPLLLTPPTAVDGSALHPAVEQELVRVLPESATVTVLGGTAALPAPVADAVAALGFDVERVGGADRYETAVAIAERLGSPAEVVLATGLDFADPLVAAPLAAAEGRALLLTAGEELPAATATYLSTVETGTALAVGGPAAAAVPDAEPLMGANRFATAAAVAQERFPEATVAGVASGMSFADAATGGTHIAALGGPLLLTPSDRVSLDAAFVIGTSPTIEALFVYGGTAVVPEVLLLSYDASL